MKHPLRPLAVPGAALALLAGLVAAGPAAGAAARGPASSTPMVLHVSQIDKQDVKTQKGCEPGTLVEPDVAVSPTNPRIQVAVAHDCRFSNGGALDISYAWTHDGGAVWHHAPLPGLTRIVGGVWARASDPVVAFAPDGSVYISSLVIDNGCPSGVAVSKSVNGGATFSKPVMVQQSKVCTVSDDKEWLVIDNQKASPWFGRVYVFWTEFLSNASGTQTGVPQVVRWSDDGGQHWSPTAMVTMRTANTQDSQPMIAPNGDVTDVFLSFPPGATGGAVLGAMSRHHDDWRLPTASSGTDLVATTSSDGGSGWTSPVKVAGNIGGGPAGIRCCLPAAESDPVTGARYVVWDGNGPGTQDPVWLSRSSDGTHWSSPVAVTSEHNPAIQHVNLAVAAFRRKVFVSYGNRNSTVSGGNLVQQMVSTSVNGGVSFGRGMPLGPVSNLTWAAQSRGAFPGDYIGASATATRLTLVWCLSSKPSNPNAKFNQTLWAAVLKP